ncbi:MAG: hypothetical protein A3H36_02620 [Chloroflexi bacterium RIFCSPLOWO2_02_FULL_71_16]|nr:MAG: hypothetical protein A3H36_02620 [Chloroflexi bacterium RIFCSPLOWO2_02_FULL_71_16]
MIRGLFTLVLLLVLGGAGLAYLMSQQQPEAASGLRPVRTSVKDAVTFDEKIASVEVAIETAKRTSTAQRVSLLFTDAELTSRAALAADQLTGGIVATDPQIHVRAGSVLLTAGVSFQGFPLNLAVVAIPVAVDGRTSIGIQEIQTGGLPLPDLIKKELDAQIAKILDPATLGIPLDVTRIEAREGSLLVELVANP